MTFVFEGGPFGIAVDRERDITIRRRNNRFLDDAAAFPFEIIVCGWQFDFEVNTVTQTRTFIEGGRAVTRQIEIGAYVVESALVIRTASLSRDELKAALKEGLYVLLTYGGRRLQFVPDYRVEFVSSAAELATIRAEVMSGKRNN